MTPSTAGWSPSWLTKMGWRDGAELEGRAASTDSMVRRRLSARSNVKMIKGMGGLRTDGRDERSYSLLLPLLMLLLLLLLLFCLLRPLFLFSPLTLLLCFVCASYAVDVQRRDGGCERLGRHIVPRDAIVGPRVRVRQKQTDGQQNAAEAEHEEQHGDAVATREARRGARAKADERRTKTTTMAADDAAWRRTNNRGRPTATEGGEGKQRSSQVE